MSSSSDPLSRPCAVCGCASCTCDDCRCTETLCRCAASSVLDALASHQSCGKKAPIKKNKDPLEVPVHKLEAWIEGMTCSMCAQSIEGALSQLPGVQTTLVSVTTDTAVVEYTDETTPQAIQEAIEAVGYTVERVRHLVGGPPAQAGDEEQASSTSSTAEPIEERWERLTERQARKVRAQRNAFLWSLVGAVPILFLTMILPHLAPAWMDQWTSIPVKIGALSISLETFILWLLATPVQFISGWHFYKMSYYSLTRSGKAGMDVLVAVGTTASYVYALYGGVFRGELHTAHFFETSVSLIVFVLAGKWMQAVAVRRTSQALTQLMHLQAKTAVKVTPFKDRQNFHPFKDPYMESVVAIEDVREGDMVKVVLGTSIPADGRVIFGEVAVDESMVTGESLPVLKTPGSLVLGGTICVEADSASESAGAAFISVTGVGSKTALAQIVQLVSDAQTRSVPIQSFADQIAAVFVPAVCAISLLTYLVWYALCSAKVVPEEWYTDLGEDPMTFSLMFGIACLVISCPCALGLATPTAIMVGTGVGAKNGVLMKGGEALEVASSVNAVIFDKTGTLTKGTPVITDFFQLDDAPGMKVETSSGLDESAAMRQHFLWLFASLERTSEHPLAKAIVQYAELKLSKTFLANKPFMQPTNFRPLTGRGASGNIGDTSLAIGNRAFATALGLNIPRTVEECMTCLEDEGRTAILAAVNDKVCIVMGIADELKPDASRSISYLREQLGIDVWMVTGDNARTANAISRQLGIPANRVISEALPVAKVQEVQRLQREGYCVAMVGDGVNDSPALAQANVGISLGTGAEIAAEASDMVLVKGNVADVCTALHLSRAIFRRIQLNFLWSLLYNCLGIPVAAGVFYPLVHTRLPPTVAALAMALSSISVVLSSLSLRLYKPPDVNPAQAIRRRRGRRAAAALARALRRRSVDNEELTEDLLQEDPEAAQPSETDQTESTRCTDNRTVTRMERDGE